MALGGRKATLSIKSKGWRRNAYGIRCPAIAGPVAPENREQEAKIGVRRIEKGSKIKARAWEQYLAKVGVEGSNPFARSKFP